MFLIDLDNTLLDTAGSFKDARIAALSKLGISHDLYEESYLAARNTSEGNTVYNNFRHAKALSLFGFDEEKVLAELDNLNQPENIKKFLFPDALDFLEKLKKFEMPMLLLTLGNPEFQESKVKALGLEKYFDRIIFTDDSKADKVSEIMKTISNHPVWLINDRIKENLEVKERFPEIKILQKIYPMVAVSEYEMSGMPFFNSLSEMYEYIVKYK